MNALDDEEITCILEAQGEPTFVNDIGKKDKFAKIIIRHVLLDSRRSQLEELKEGLRSLDLLSRIQEYPERFREIFTSESVEAIDAATVEVLFKIAYDESGSNQRPDQERAIVFWRDYLLDCERKHNANISNPDSDSLPILLSSSFLDRLTLLKK